jgi:hypothetical protein
MQSGYRGKVTFEKYENEKGIIHGTKKGESTVQGVM